MTFFEKNLTFGKNLIVTFNRVRAKKTFFMIF